MFRVQLTKSSQIYLYSCINANEKRRIIRIDFIQPTSLMCTDQCVFLLKLHDQQIQPKRITITIFNLDYVLFLVWIQQNTTQYNAMHFHGHFSSAIRFLPTGEWYFNCDLIGLIRGYFFSLSLSPYAHEVTKIKTPLNEWWFGSLPLQFLC